MPRASEDGRSRQAQTQRSKASKQLDLSSNTAHTNSLRVLDHTPLLPHAHLPQALCRLPAVAAAGDGAPRLLRLGEADPATLLPPPPLPLPLRYSLEETSPAARRPLGAVSNLPEAEYFLLLLPLPAPVPAPLPAPPPLRVAPVAEADDVPAGDGRRGGGPPPAGEAIAAGDGDRRAAGGVWRRRRWEGRGVDEASDLADSDNRDLRISAAAGTKCGGRRRR